MLAMPCWSLLFGWLGHVLEVRTWLIFGQGWDKAVSAVL
jgi:hypothetical protein